MLLVKQLSSVEQQCWKNAQYSRRECVEVVGIPSSFEHDKLESTVCRLNSAQYRCKYFWVQNRSRPSTGLKYRQDHYQIFQQKRFWAHDACQNRFKRSWCYWTWPFSLCPYYRGLRNETKKLWNKKKYFIILLLVVVRIRLQEKGPHNIITHIDDLKELFPDKDFSMF